MENLLFKFGAGISLAIAVLGCWVIWMDSADPLKSKVEVAIAGLAVLGVFVGIAAGYVSLQSSKESARQISDTREQLAAANGRIEGERSARLELENALAPRSIEQGESSKALLPFKGMSVGLLSTPDAEPTSTAAAIEFLLRMGGWNVKRGIANPGALMGIGLLIETKISGLRHGGDRSGEAAEELLAQLKMRSDVLGAHLDWLTDETIPPNTLKITVGPVPPRYFQDKQLEEWKKKMQDTPPQ